MQSLSLPSLRLLALLLWAACGLSLPASAAREEKKEPLPPPPPQAVEQKVEVPRGQAVQIPLKIYGSQRETLRFLIRSAPEHGKLTAPKATGKEAAMVTYTPPADYEVTEDQFTYAAGSSAGVSAAAAVTIRIVDAPSLLAIPGELPFAPLLAGQKAPKEFEITNRGGGVAAGVIQVAPPWKLEGVPEYRLPEGMSRTVRVIFAPTEAGAFRGEIRFSSHPTHTTVLRGEAQAPLTVIPELLELTHPPGDPQRGLEAKMENHTDAPQTVALKPGEGLKVSPESLTIPPQSSASFQIRAAEGNLGPIESVLQVVAEQVEFEIPVKAARVKPVLQAALRELRLERPPAGGRPAGTVVVENVGGEEGFWRWELLAPFMTLETEARIAPGAQVTIPIQLEAQASGNYRTILKIIGEQQTLEIPVLGDAMIAENAAARKTAAPSQPRRAATPSSQFLQASTASEAEEPQAVPYPYKRIGIKERTPDRLVLVWLAEQYRPEAYRVERRFLSLDAENELKIDWSPVPQQTVQAFDKKGVRAELTGLEPDQLYVLRLTVEQPGSPERIEVGGIEVTTPSKPPLVQVTLLRGLLLLLAVCIALALWRRHRMARG